MIVRRFTLPFAASLFGLALAAGVARADVAPDAGKPADMTTTQAKPDMTVVAPTDDGGCSMGGHGAAAGSSLVVLGAAAGLIFASRRRTA